MSLEFRPFGGEPQNKEIDKPKETFKLNLLEEDNIGQNRRLKKLLEELNLSTEVDLSTIEQYNPKGLIDHSKLSNLYEDEKDSSLISLNSEMDNEYFGISHTNLLKNIREFTRLDKEITLDEDYREYSRDLESLRMFPKDFLADKGIFISLSKQDTIETFPYLRNSALYLTGTDDAYSNRYMIPIKLPNGDVVTHTGYRPGVFDIPGPKYETSFYEWMSQGSVIGNMESLLKYDSKHLYVVEGMFDAYRINQILEKPSIAMLGSLLTKEKSTILNLLRSDGYVLIYVPDQDESGMSVRLLNNKLFDNVMTYGDFEMDKDFDSYCGNRYVNFLKKKYKNDVYKQNTSTISDIDEDELKIINQGIIKDLKYKIPLQFTLPKITIF